MEIKIGICNVTREVVIDSTETTADVEAKVEKTFKDGVALTLTDERGRKVIVPGDKIGYVDIGEDTPRRVGFGAV